MHETRGKPEELECQRLQAHALLHAGVRPSEVARRLGVSPAAVSRWKKRSQHAGRESLKAKPHLGPRSKLTVAQRRAFGAFAATRPSRPRLSDRLVDVAADRRRIETQFGVRYDPSGVWHVLRGIGGSCRNPRAGTRTRASHRPGLHGPAAYKKTLAEAVELLFFSMKQALCSSRWSAGPGVPRGILPAIPVGTSRPPLRDFGGRRLAAAPAPGLRTLPSRSTTSVPPTSKSLCAELLEHFSTWDPLVWDRWSVHLSAVKRPEQRFPRRVRIEWLPSHCPEVNPDGQIWTQTKYRDLANFCPDTLRELTQAVRHSLEHTKSHPSLLRSLLRACGAQAVTPCQLFFIHLKINKSAFGLCGENRNCEDLEKWKVYVVVPRG